MDTHAFASLAHVQVLLIPVGTIHQSVFEKCAAEIRSFDDIRLGDVPADQKDEKARFMPSPLSPGHLHLSFPSHPPPSSHLPLSLLRPSHFPLAVVGVASCSSSQPDTLSSILTQFNALLYELFPPGSMFPLARNCFVFEEGDGNLNFGDNVPGVVVIPSLMGNKKLYIGTLLADLCSNVLGEFGVVVQALESPLGNEYLNSSLLPILPPMSELPASLDGRFDSFPQLSSHNSQPELIRASSTPPVSKRNSTFRQTTLGVTPPKKRSSGIGAASSHGRLTKVLGDFFLLAGRTEDAYVWYSEAIISLKASQDHVWHASALEGMATIAILDAWSAGHGLQTSGAAMREPWTDVSEKLSQATALYYKAPSNDPDQNYPLLAYLYSYSVLRHASLLFAVWSAKGWGPLAFTTMLQPGATPYLPPTLSHSTRNSWVHLERLSSISGISRTAIAGVLAQAHGPWLLHLGARERIAILETTASLYACLGYRRKEAYILREVLGCVLDLLVCGREEDGYSKKSNLPGIPGLGLNLDGQTGSRGTVAIRLSESTDGNDSILNLLKYVCKVLGIDLDAVRLVEDGVGDDKTRDSATDDSDIFDVPQGTYGWPELQVGVIRESVAVAEALPDYLAVAQFALSALKTLQSVLAPSDQYHLYSTSSRALVTARRRGETKCVEYWSGKPVVNITLSPLPLVRLPLEKPMSTLATRSSEINPVLPGGKDPFLYNPRKAAAEGKTLVVQNETLDFVVVLQNPFVFDLEIQSLTLSTSGVKFESKSVTVVIPANSLHSVTLIGKAVETGTLTIRGCIVRAPGGAAREFVLPLATDEEEERSSRRRSASACEMDRSKYSGLESLPWERPEKRSSTQLTPPPSDSLQFLQCKVVPEQPLLRIRRTSLTHGAVMLYDGEMSSVRITLENVSTLPVDFLRLAFDDSTIAPAQQALADGDLSVFDTYETEYDLINRPVFSWNKQEFSKIVAPGEKVTVTVNCLGKVGCVNGTMHVSYAYIHRHQDTLQTPPDVFHTRQLSYPVMVTVYHMLECHGMDIIPFPPSVSPDNDDVNSVSHGRMSSLRVGGDGWCLFSIDVRNTYGLPFEVTFERVQEDTAMGNTSTTVAPGSTSRIVIPLKKFLLPEDQASRIIPTLSDRQFVVTKSNLTSAEEKAQRELFWYREELFKCVRGHWREAGGIRSGDLSLRQQRLTLPMLETLRTETARVQMSLVQYDADGEIGAPIPHHGGKYHPPPNEFVYLRTKVTNLSASALILTADLGFDPAEHIIYEGVLSDLPVGHLQSGESREVETPLCFLSYGRFELAAEVRALDPSHIDSRAGFGHLVVDVLENE